MQQTTTFFTAFMLGLFLLCAQAQAQAQAQARMHVDDARKTIGTLESSNSRHRTIQLEGETYRIAASVKVSAAGQSSKDIYSLPAGQPIEITWRYVGESRLINHIHILENLPQ